MELEDAAVERCLMLAQRLARLMRDTDAQRWLDYEQRGYPETLPAGHLGSCARYAYRFNGANVVTRASLPTLEAQKLANEIVLSKTQAPAVTGVAENYLVAGATKDVMTAINAGVREARDAFVNATNTYSQLRATLHRWASDTLIALELGTAAEGIFDGARDQVDAFVSTHAPSAAQQLLAVSERMSEGTAESLSLALTSCRRLIVSVADELFPPRAEPLVDRKGKTREVGHEQYKNRLLAFLEDRIEVSIRNLEVDFAPIPKFPWLMNELAVIRQQSLRQTLPLTCGQLHAMRRDFLATRSDRRRSDISPKRPSNVSCSPRIAHLGGSRSPVANGWETAKGATADDASSTHTIFGRSTVLSIAFPRYDRAMNAQRRQLQSQLSSRLRLVPRAARERSAQAASFSVTRAAKDGRGGADRNLIGATGQHLETRGEQAQNLGLDRARLPATPEAHQPHRLSQCPLDLRLSSSRRSRSFGTSFGTEFCKYRETLWRRRESNSSGNKPNIWSFVLFPFQMRSFPVVYRVSMIARGYERVRLRLGT